MNAYQELDGIPCAANRWLLTDLLRGEWGFDGTVVSDYFAIKQLDDYHHVVGSWEEAAVAALTAGIDVELPSTECYGDVLRAAIERGAIAMTDVDEAVRRVLESKLRLGLFERPLRRRRRVAVHTRTGEQIELSRQTRDREPGAAAQRRHPAAATPTSRRSQSSVRTPPTPARCSATTATSRTSSR